MVRFDYFEPQNISDTCALLDEHGEEARLIAGGTALLIMMRLKLLNPRVVVSLAKLPDFDAIRFDPKTGLTIGAGARHRDIELHPAVREHYPLLHETFRKVAQPRIRNMATLGGNLCQGDPLTDPGASLLALDASVVLASSQGERMLPLDEFFIDYYQTAAEPGEIMTEIRVPPPAAGLRWAHIKFLPRSQEDFATVGVALALKTTDGRCDDIRLGLNSVAPTILRAKKAEALLRGEKISERLIGGMAEAAAFETDPIDDNRGSAEYKREMVKVLVGRAVAQALGN
ncbi:MAG TPA: xanthine dehydrogenase family protein subunit M [Verrucomicrobiae bacterium]|jgi:carbon-monoxide dehydrogenase medium subunit|nr:xanthine dehydrogenase family protein subunit M [Verrucomicrobiae bacterium]